VSAKTPPLFLFLSRWVLMRTRAKSRRTAYDRRFPIENLLRLLSIESFCRQLSTRFLRTNSYQLSMVRSCRKATMLAHGGAIWMVLSIAASLALVSSSSCSPIDPGAAQLPAPTNVGSAVQYAVLTARQNSSECLAVDGAVLRGLLVHVAFDGTLGFPGEGPPKRYVCPLSSATLTDKGPSRSARCRECPGCRKKDANVPCETWKTGCVCACCCCSCARA